MLWKTISCVPNVTTHFLADHASMDLEGKQLQMEHTTVSVPYLGLWWSWSEKTFVGVLKPAQDRWCWTLDLERSNPSA